jgi:hypothetical protein
VKDHGSEEIGVLSLDCADYVHVWIEDIPYDRRPVRQARSAALHNGLRALGWENGHNVRIEWRWASGDATLGLCGRGGETVARLFVATGSPALAESPR